MHVSAQTLKSNQKYLAVYNSLGYRPGITAFPSDLYVFFSGVFSSWQTVLHKGVLLLSSKGGGGGKRDFKVLETEAYV